jgi:hypothetical protein
MHSNGIFFGAKERSGLAIDNKGYLFYIFGSRAEMPCIDYIL